MVIFADIHGIDWVLIVLVVTIGIVFCVGYICEAVGRFGNDGLLHIGAD